MANKMLVIGETGSGKSTATKTLNPESTFYINVIGKPLPFKGWKSKYQPYDSTTKKGNMIKTHSSSAIIDAMNFIDKQRPEIKTIVVDDTQYVMSYEFMERAKERGLTYTSPCMV